MNIGNRGQPLSTATDGLLALSVAEHAKDKEFRLRNIAGIFAGAMHKKWPERLYYVDPFCGPGRCIVRNSGEELEGSPLIASKFPFTFYYFADENGQCIEALKSRLLVQSMTGKLPRYFTGRADQTIDEILKLLPPKQESLGLAFLDPWAWDFSFQSLQKLTEGRRLDVLINFNIGYMKRNWAEESAAMDSFLNLKTDHREYFRSETRGIPDTRTLLDHYEAQLREIGYQHIADDRPVMNSNNTPLYHMIFGSKHELGVKLRDAVSRKTFTGQMELFEEAAAYTTGGSPIVARGEGV